MGQVHETFPVYGQIGDWVDSGVTSKFSMDAGNFYSDFEREYGLYTRYPDREYAKSLMLQDTFTGPFSMQFDVKYEQKQTCGTSALRLYNELDQRELNSETPFLVSIGPHYCDKMSSILVQISDTNGELHDLKVPLFAPIDQEWHTYRLTLDD